MKEKHFSHILILIFCIKGSKGSGFFSFFDVSPKKQIVTEGEDVQMNCSPRFGEYSIHWERENKKRLPEQAFQFEHGQLLIKNVKASDSGIYYCIQENKLRKYVAYVAHLTVKARTPTTANPFASTSKGIKIFPTTFFTNTTGENIFTTGSPLDIRDGTSALLQDEFFKCGDGKKIKKTRVCDKINDCSDNSDENNCAVRPPQITLLPSLKVEVFCGDQDEARSGELVLYCEFAGSPELQIKWKKYEGHVPTKCQQSSFNGHGILKCPKFKQADQGAYSCVAQNSQGLSESQPKSIAKCSNTMHCKGFTVTERFSSDAYIENCLECYCSGKTTQCYNIQSNLTVHKIPFPEELSEIIIADNNILLRENVSAPSIKGRDEKVVKVSYCTLYKESLEEISFLKSYGRNINIPRFTGKTDFVKNAPDLVIEGNDVALSYRFNMISHLADTVDVRFWPGNWHHLNDTVASRADLMKVLSNVNKLHFRCEYKQRNLLKWDAKRFIYIESSKVSENSNSVSYLEKCNCPAGYEGLSCESCAPGYEKIILGNDFTCKKIILCPVCYTGYNCTECDTANNCYKSKGICTNAPCHPVGSVSTIPDSRGKCNCKKNVVGDFCDECKDEFFNVEAECTECWCSGVTKKCISSNWTVTVLSSTSPGGYNSSDGRNFWLLSPNFNGNRLTSYGGNLNYTIRYIPNIPKQNDYLSVEFLTVENRTIVYSHPDIDTSVYYNEKSWSVKLVEKYWKNPDKSSLTRGEFLTVLTKIKAIYIESPYHLASGKANLTSARMTSAEPTGVGEVAVSVEMCSCPPGYTGLSCEECSEGYYLSRKGNKTTCVKCDCENCDPLIGCILCPAGYYQTNVGESPPLCEKCRCNGNEKSCHIDSFGQIFCICKPGFTGIYCENEPPIGGDSYLRIRISPLKVKGQKVGKTVKFNCSYESDEKIKISVKKTFAGGVQLVVDKIDNYETSIKYGSYSLFEVTLVENLESVDCYFHDAEDKVLGHIRGAIENIIMHPKPVKITNCYSDRVLVKENESFDLICEAEGSPTPSIIWFKTTETGQMEKIDTLLGTHSLESPETSLDKNGTIYTCLAENIEGSKDKCSRILFVEQKCDFLRITPEKLEIEEGEKISLQCKSTKKTPLTWSKVNGTLSYFHKIVSDGHFEIKSAVAADSGTYVCTAQLETGMLNTTASVVVKKKRQPPTVYISDNDKKLKVGDNYTITCVSQGIPKPIIKWYKDESFLPQNVHINGNDLTIVGAKIKNNGLYKCEGKSTEGIDNAYILIEVEDNLMKPKIEINSPSKVRAIEGDQLIINCIVIEGNPKPTVEWWKKGFFGESKYQEGKFLQIKNISRTDSGDYNCIARNSEGTERKQVNVEVLIPPTVTLSEKEISAHEGDSVTISCTATGYPEPVISWARTPLFDVNSSTIPRNSVKLLEKPLLVTEKQITFKVSKEMHLTSVICIAENEAGNVEKSVVLKILKPRIKSSEEIVEHVLIGSPLDLICQSPDGNVTWTKDNGTYESDICVTPVGLYIPSVQIQHRGKYICKYGSETIKIINLVVGGFVPKFNRARRSYLVLPVKVKSTDFMHIKLFFKPLAGTGVLLQNRNLDVYLKNGKVHLSLFSKQKTVYIEMKKVVELNKWYQLVIDVSPSSKYGVDMTLYDENTEIYERKTESEKQLSAHHFTFEVQDNMYVGRWHPDTFIMRYSYNLFLNKIPSFEGCISRIIINFEEFNIVKNGSYSSNITLCRTCEEEKDLCKGKGKCFDAPIQKGYMCVCSEEERECPASCSQRGCETQLDLCNEIRPCGRPDLHKCFLLMDTIRCSCAYGYSGLTCEKVEENSFCSTGNGYVRLPSNLLTRRDLQEPEIIKMSFTLKKSDGVLLWRGDDTNYLYIVVQNGNLMYVHYSQRVELSIIGQTKLPLDKKVKMTIVRRNNTATMDVEIENNNSWKQTNSAKFVTSRIRGDIYLGNMANNTRFYNSGFVGLNGCIHYTMFGNNSQINLKDVALEIKNVVTKPGIPDNFYDTDIDYHTEADKHNDLYDSDTESQEDDEDFSN